MTGRTEDDPLDRIEAAIAFREEDPDSPQVVTISTRRAAALVAVARAARDQDAKLDRLAAGGHVFIRLEDARIDPDALARET